MRLTLLKKVDDAHDDSVWALAWIPGSNEIITGSVDETAKTWAEITDEEVPESEKKVLNNTHTFTDVALGAVSVAVDSTGSYGAMCSLDSNIVVWKTANNDLAGSAKQNPSEAWGIAFMPSSSPEDPPMLAIAGGSSNKIRLWDVTNQKEVFSADMPSNEETQTKEKFVLSIAVSSDGKMIAAGAMDGTVALFDATNGQLLHRLSGHFKPVRAVTFTPDNKFVLTGCDDCHVNMYDVQGGALVDSFSGHENWVVTVAVHPDGSAFVSGGADGKIKLWDLSTRTCVQTVSDHADQVWGVGWRPDGSRLASCSDDRSLCLWSFA